MRRLQIAFGLALIAALAGGGAAAWLWYHPRVAAATVQPAGLPTAATSTTTPAAAPAEEPALQPVQLTPERMQSIGVKTDVVAFKTLHDDIRTTGTVEVNETGVSWIQLRYPGWIQKVFADALYQPVRKGERLFTIYSPDIAATEREYLLALENQGLLGQSTVPGVASGSSSLLSAATDRLQQWQIPDSVIEQMKATHSVPKEIEIDSPVNGVVTERNAFPSAYVQPGTKLYTIADLSSVWVYAQVQEGDLSRVKVGTPATITADARPGLTFSGRVSFIQPQVDETTRTAKARIEVANPKQELALGTFLNVTLSAPLGTQLTIPASGVFQSGTRQIAFVDRGGGYFEPREVETGEQSDDELVVLKGLKAGERIVTSANFLIDSESQLQAAMGSFAPPPPGAGAAAAMNGTSFQPAQPGAQASIEYSSTPETPKAGTDVFHVRLKDSNGAPITGANVTVTYFMAAMPAMGMAAMRTVATLPDKGGGLYEGNGQVQMHGTWQVTVVATKNGQMLAQKQLDVTAVSK